MLALGTAACLLAGPLVSLSGTAQTLRVVAWLVLLCGAWVTYERSRKYAFRRQELAPMAVALAGRIGNACYVHDPRQWINMPIDAQDGATIIYLPAEYSPGDAQEKALARMVARKRGMHDPSWSFNMQGERPYLELVPAPAPRDLVDFRDPAVRRLVELCLDGAPLLGLGPRDKPCTLDLDADAPHVGFSMATNAGKSVAARALIAQILHSGGLALILDRKQVSQAWCRGLPHVRYASSPQEIHEALLWLSVEIDRRFDVIKLHADIRGNVDPALVGPRLLVVAEELNTLSDDVGTYWRSIRQQGDPLRPSSLAALGRSMAMGRAGRVNVVPIGQKITAQAIGGTTARENMSTRVLGRASTSAWNMLAPECKVNGRYPKKSMHRGRVYVVADDEATPVQVLLIDEQDAIDYATSGTVSVFADLGDLGQQVKASDHRETGASDLGQHDLFDAFDDDEPDELAELAEVDEVSLSDAAERLALTIDTLRNASKRDSSFPRPLVPGVGVPSVYDFAAIEKWVINK